jgi:hypothetical protein
MLSTDLSNGCPRCFHKLTEKGTQKMALFPGATAERFKRKRSSSWHPAERVMKEVIQCRRGRSGALRVKLREESRQWQLSVEQILKICLYFAISPPLPCDSTLRDSSLCSVHQSIGRKGVWDVLAVERFLRPENKGRTCITYGGASNQCPHFHFQRPLVFFGFSPAMSSFLRKSTPFSREVLS